MSRVWILIPTYNEAENIQSFVEALENFKFPISNFQLGILVVDDVSPDGTGDIVEGLRGKYKNLYLLRRPKKAGLGSAYLDGFRYVLERLGGGDLFVEIDADGSHQIADLKTLISLISADNADMDVDVLVGSRFVKGGSLDYPWHRKILSWMANAFANLVLGLGVADATSGFKVYKRPVVESFLEDGFSSSGYSFQVETLLRARNKGFKIREVPITFIDRKKGVSKMGFREIWKGAAAIIKLKIKNEKLKMRRKTDKPVNRPTDTRQPKTDN